MWIVDPRVHYSMKKLGIYWKKGGENLLFLPLKQAEEGGGGGGLELRGYIPVTYPTSLFKKIKLINLFSFKLTSLAYFSSFLKYLRNKRLKRSIKLC